jgi:hypothetical protein
MGEIVGEGLAIPPFFLNGIDAIGTTRFHRKAVGYQYS